MDREECADARVDDHVRREIFQGARAVHEMPEHGVHDFVHYEAEAFVGSRDVFLDELGVVPEHAVGGDAGGGVVSVFFHGTNEGGDEAVFSHGVAKQAADGFERDVHDDPLPSVSARRSESKKVWARSSSACQSMPCSSHQ